MRLFLGFWSKNVIFGRFRRNFHIFDNRIEDSCEFPIVFMYNFLFWDVGNLDFCVCSNSNNFCPKNYISRQISASEKQCSRRPKIKSCTWKPSEIRSCLQFCYQKYENFDENVQKSRFLITILQKVPFSAARIFNPIDLKLFRACYS